MRDPDKPRSVASARESIRYLLRTRVPYLDVDGLKIPRDNERHPDALDVDDVLERLEVLGVPDDTVKIAVIRRKDGSAYFEVQINRAGTEHLAPLYPDLQRGLEQLKAALEEQAAGE